MCLWRKIMNKKLFKRAQNVNTLGKYVLFTVTVCGIENFSSDRKRFAREKINNLFVSLSHHPDYIGCFDKGLTMFNDNCFGISCEEQYVDGLTNTIDRFIKSFNFDVVIASGRFETMDYAECDSKYYGGDLYTTLCNAHKRGGIGKKFYRIVKGKH